MLISLIIPTRERSQFLQESLKTATAVPDREIEIIVSDNASEDSTREIVERCRDPRLKYVNTGRRVSMRQNFEFALENSSGDYVIYIGDDDGFLPGQFQCLRRILEQDRPDVFTWRRLTYGWPIAGFGKRTGGVRFQRKHTYGAPRRIDLTRRARLLHNAQVLDLDKMPAIYHGCASRQYLDSIKMQAGASFGAKSPDVYFTYYATLTNASLLYSAHPFTISGHSPVSTGNASHYRSGDKRIWPATRFSEEASTDSVQDVVAGFATLSLNQFSTYETVCDHLGLDVAGDRREAWYRYVLETTNKSDVDMFQSVVDILDAYATKTGTESELRTATTHAANGLGIRGDKFRARFRKLWSRAQSVKFSAARDGSNTVFTATQLVDDLLGSDYQAALEGRHRPLRLWTRLLARGARRLVSPAGRNRSSGSDPSASPGTDDTARAA